MTNEEQLKTVNKALILEKKIEEFNVQYNRVKSVQNLGNTPPAPPIKKTVYKDVFSPEMRVLFDKWLPNEVKKKKKISNIILRDHPYIISFVIVLVIYIIFFQDNEYLYLLVLPISIFIGSIYMKKKRKDFIIEYKEAIEKQYIYQKKQYDTVVYPQYIEYWKGVKEQWRNTESGLKKLLQELKGELDVVYSSASFIPSKYKNIMALENIYMIMSSKKCAFAEAAQDYEQERERKRIEEDERRMEALQREYEEQEYYARRREEEYYERGSSSSGTGSFIRDVAATALGTAIGNRGIKKELERQRWEEERRESEREWERFKEEQRQRQEDSRRREEERKRHEKEQKEYVERMKREQEERWERDRQRELERQRRYKQGN